MTATDLTTKLNALCDLLGISPAEALEALGKLGDAPVNKKAPTVNEVIPEVDKLVRAETKRASKPYWLFLAEEHGDKSLDDIDKPMLEALLLRLEEAPRQSVKRKNWKNGSGAKRSAVHAWRRMWEYAIDKGFTAKNPAQALRMPKRLPNERRGLTRAEVEMIYEVAASTGDDPTLDCVLIRLLLETGCRRMGALKLTTGSLKHDKQTLVFEEKNGKTREMPISLVLQQNLIELARSRGASFDDDKSCLLRYANGTPLTDRRFDYLFRRIQTAKPFSDAANVSAHWLRHTAIRWIERSSSEATAATFAGHTPVRNRVSGVYMTAAPIELVRAWCDVWKVDHPLAHEE